jgi:hypothetical protein
VGAVQGIAAVASALSGSSAIFSAVSFGLNTVGEVISMYNDAVQKLKPVLDDAIIQKAVVSGADPNPNSSGSNVSGVSASVSATDVDLKIKTNMPSVASPPDVTSISAFSEYSDLIRDRLSEALGCIQSVMPDNTVCTSVASIDLSGQTKISMSNAPTLCVDQANTLPTWTTAQVNLCTLVAGTTTLYSVPVIDYWQEIGKVSTMGAPGAPAPLFSQAKSPEDASVLSVQLGLTLTFGTAVVADYRKILRWGVKITSTATGALLYQNVVVGSEMANTALTGHPVDVTGTTFVTSTEVPANQTVTVYIAPFVSAATANSFVLSAFTATPFTATTSLQRTVPAGIIDWPKPSSTGVWSVAKLAPHTKYASIYASGTTFNPYIAPGFHGSYNLFKVHQYNMTGEWAYIEMYGMAIDWLTTISPTLATLASTMSAIPGLTADHLTVPSDFILYGHPFIGKSSTVITTVLKGVATLLVSFASAVVAGESNALEVVSGYFGAQLLRPHLDIASTLFEQ